MTLKPGDKVRFNNNYALDHYVDFDKVHVVEEVSTSLYYQTQDVALEGIEGTFPSYWLEPVDRLASAVQNMLDCLRKLELGRATVLGLETEYKKSLENLEEVMWEVNNG